MSNFKIQIDDFEFKLISKSVITEESDYYKVEIISMNLNTSEETKFFAYISQSGTIWRLCSKYDNGSLLKYDNYIQATILDFRLQAFIFKHYESLPVYSQSEITCVYTPEEIKEFNLHIDGRGVKFIDSMYILNETTKKNITDAYEQTIPTQSFIKKYNTSEFEIYKSMVFSTVYRILSDTKNTYDKYKKENNKYENVPVSDSGLNAVISFYFDKDWFNNKQTNLNDYFELQNYLMNNYEIINDSNNPIDLSKDLLPEKLIMEYDLNFSFGKFKNKIYQIRLKHKQNNNVVVVFIGKISLNLNQKPTFTRDKTFFNGYYVCNIIDENVKITKYGLYESYYTEPDYTDISGRGNIVTNFTKKYITKPLEYADQINYEYCMGQFIFNSHYNFMCNCNEEKFLIRELIEKESKLSDSTFKSKYLKYKQKYTSLKNKLSKTI